MNVVALLGRLTADPELRQTPQGISVIRFTVAVNRAYVKQGEERKADFVPIVAWRQTAEFVSKYFKKGQMIGVSGSIEIRNYVDKDNNKRTATEIMANNVYFAESKGSGSLSGGTPQIPNTGTAPLAFSAGDAEDFSITDDSGDLPF